MVMVVLFIVVGLFMFTYHSTKFAVEGFVLVSKPATKHTLVKESLFVLWFNSRAKQFLNQFVFLGII